LGALTTQGPIRCPEKTVWDYNRNCFLILCGNILKLYFFILKNY